MVYAPVLITTINRPKHLKRLIESLKKNSYAVHTDVYIYVDYPPNNKYLSGNQEVLEYVSVLGNNHGFKNLYVIKRDRNYGSLDNYSEAINELFTVYDSLILIGDDVECSPNFLEWMDKCLERYENDENVLSILGYSYPIDWEVSKEATVIKQNFVSSDWGIAFWKSKYYTLSNAFGKEDYFKHVKHVLKRKAFPNLIDARYVDLLVGASNVNDRSPYRKVGDFTIGVYIGIENKYAVMPIVSKVRTYGFDGSGFFCPGSSYDPNKKMDAHNYNYASQKIDESEHIDLIENELNNLEVNRRLLNEFDSRPRKVIIKAKIRYCFYKIVGKKVFTQIWRWKTR